MYRNQTFQDPEAPDGAAVRIRSYAPKGNLILTICHTETVKFILTSIFGSLHVVCMINNNIKNVRLKN